MALPKTVGKQKTDNTKANINGAFLLTMPFAGTNVILINNITLSDKEGQVNWTPRPVAMIFVPQRQGSGAL